MDSIQDILQCKWCFSQLSDPVILPCGDTVCRKHTEELRKADWSCMLCSGVHKLAKDEQFLVNKTIIALLSANLSKLDFGPTYNDAKERVKNLKSKQSELKHIISEPKDFVSRELYKYRNQADVFNEEMKKLVDDVCLESRKEIDQFQTEATKAIVEKKTADLTSFDQGLDKKMTNWKETLDKLVVNEPLWKEIVDETKQNQEQLDKKLASAIDEIPPTIVNTTMSMERRIWIKLSQRLDKKSLWIRDLSKISKSKSWPDIVSESFTLKDHLFNFLAKFTLKDEKLFMSVYLHLISETIKEPVKLSWTFNIFVNNSQLIKSASTDYEFNKKTGWGFSNLMALSDIIDHQDYNAQEDMVRVQVVIKD